MPVAKLPHPANWKKWAILPALGFLMFVAVGVYSVVQTAIAMHRGHYLAATITGGFAVFTLGAVLTIAVSRIRSNTLRGVSDSTGTTLRPDPVAIYLLGVTFVGAVLSSAVFVTFVPGGNVEIPFSVPGGEVVSILYMTALLLLAVTGLVALILRGGSICLRLAPYGLQDVDILQTRTASWNDVTDITDAAPNKPTRQPISFVVKDAKPIVIQNASGYAPNGAALYWMVRHYWKHPENRAELADGRALERLRNERFDPE